jgi:hypothetical protein
MNVFPLPGIVISNVACDKRDGVQWNCVVCLRIVIQMVRLSVCLGNCVSVTYLQYVVFMDLRHKIAFCPRLLVASLGEARGVRARRRKLMF